MKVIKVVLMVVIIGVSLPCLLLANGKSKCYDEFGSFVSCPGDGGDSAVYRDNGNGTVSDLKTGFIWQQTDDRAPRKWEDAKDYCKALTLGGLSPWRMPELKELETVAEFGRSQYVMNTVFKYQHANYWTATLSSQDPSKASTIGFSDSDSMAHSKEQPHFIRCILGSH